MTTEISTQTAQPSLMEARIKGTRLNAIPRQQAVESIARTLYNATLYRGQAPDENMVAFTAASLYDEIMRESERERSCALNLLTIPEIDYAIKQAVLHKDMYITVATTFQALEDYAKGEGNRLRIAIEEKKKNTPDGPYPNPIDAMMRRHSDTMIKKSKIR